MSKKTSIKKPPRNPIVVAMNKRHHGNQTHRGIKDKRGGNTNEQVELLIQAEEDSVDDSDCVVETPSKE